MDKESLEKSRLKEVRVGPAFRSPSLNAKFFNACLQRTGGKGAKQSRQSTLGPQDGSLVTNVPSAAGFMSGESRVLIFL